MPMLSPKSAWGNRRQQISVPNPGPRQLYPSKPHFRQSYAFSGATPDGPKAFDDAFQTPKPASLCFNCGKIIVYGTLSVTGPVKLPLWQHYEFQAKFHYIR